jgi:hypothetical protein
MTASGGVHLRHFVAKAMKNTARKLPNVARRVGRGIVEIKELGDKISHGGVFSPQLGFVHDLLHKCAHAKIADFGLPLNKKCQRFEWF